MIKSTISKLTSEHARTLIDWNLTKPHSRKTNPSSGFAIAADIPGLQGFFSLYISLQNSHNEQPCISVSQTEALILGTAHTVPK